MLLPKTEVNSQPPGKSSPGGAARVDLCPLDAPRLKTPRKDPAVAQGSVGRAASLLLGGLALPRPWACPLQVHEAPTPWCHPSAHTRRSCLPACVRSDPWGSLSDHPLLARCPLPRLDHEEPLLHPGAFVACISSWNILHCPSDAGTVEWSDPAGPPRPHRVRPCSPTPQRRLSRARHLPSQFTQTESTRSPALAESKDPLAQKPLPCRSAHFSAS